MSPLPKGSTWMQDNLEWLNEVEIGLQTNFPGSHNAGMYKISEHTTFAHEKLLQTQSLPVYEQLQHGVRWLDIRPMLKNGEFFCGYFTEVGDHGWQGGLGAKLLEVIEDINRFTRQSKELIIIWIPHARNAADGKQLTDDQQITLVRLFMDKVEHIYKPSYNELVHQENLAKYVGTDGCVVLTGMDWPESLESLGIYDMDYYPNLVKCQYKPYLLDDPAKSLYVSAGVTWDLGKDSSEPSLLERNESLRKWAYPSLPQSLIRLNSESSRATRTVVLQLDNICDDSAMNMCIAKSKIRRFIRRIGYVRDQNRHEIIAVYGGQLITDETVRANIQEQIVARKKFKVDGALFGGIDPWPGSRKSCCIFISEERGSDEGETLFWKGRFAWENDEIDFETDIMRIAFNDRYLTGEKYYDAYAALITARMGHVPFKLDPKTMSFCWGQRDDDEDVAAKKPAKMAMQYDSLSRKVQKYREIQEGHVYDFSKDIDFIRWHDWVVDEPIKYRHLFGRIDGFIKEPLKVDREFFGRKDPAPGIKKTACISIPDKAGGFREVSKEEGELWDLSKLLD